MYPWEEQWQAAPETANPEAETAVLPWQENWEGSPAAQGGDVKPWEEQWEAATPEPEGSSAFRRAVADPAISLLGKGTVSLGQMAVGLGELSNKVMPQLIPVRAGLKAVGTVTGQGERIENAIDAVSPGKVIDRACRGAYQGFRMLTDRAEGVPAEQGVVSEPEPTMARLGAPALQGMLQELLSPETQEAFRRVQSEEGFGGKVVESIKNPSVIVNTVAESVPAMLAGGAVGRGLSAATGLARTVGAAIGEGTVTAGQMAEGLRQDDPNRSLTDRGAMLSMTTGAATGGLSMLGARFAKYLGVDDIDVLAAGGTTAGERAAQKSALRKVVEGIFTEGTLEELPQSAQEKLQDNLARGRPVMEGVADAAAEGWLAGSVMGGWANVFTAAREAAQPRQGTLDDAELNLKRTAGLTDVKRLNPTTLTAVTPNGQRIAVQFVADSGQLQGEQDPEWTLASALGSKDSALRREAEAALADAGGDRATAGRALIAAGVGRNAQTLEEVRIVDEASGATLDADVLLQVVSGRTTLGTLKHEQLHALALLSGNRSENGLLTDPETGRTLNEEKVADTLAAGEDHPVLRKMKDFLLRMVNMFRRNPQETLYQTAQRLYSTYEAQVARGERKSARSPEAAAELAARAEAAATALDARLTDRQAEGNTILLPGPQATDTGGLLLDQFGRPIPGADVPLRAPDGSLKPGMWEATTPNSEAKLAGEWDVVEADTLVTSDQAEYDQALQPRNRDTVASKQQVMSIAQQPDPGRLLDSVTTDNGAPIVAGAQVISGNGRTMGLRQAYENERAAEYRTRVLAEARKLRLKQAELMRKPVLVRRVQDTGGATLPQIAEWSNRPQVLQRSDAEQAEADARMLLESGMIESFQPDAAGAIRTAANRDFLRAFVQATGDASLLDAQGEFAPGIESRVKRSVLAALLTGHPQARNVIQEIIERGDQYGVKRQADALMISGPALLRIATTKPDYDLRAPLAQALQDLVDFQRGKQYGKWKTVQAYLAQQEMFDTGRSEESLLILKRLADTPTIIGTREWLDRYAGIVGNIDVTTGDMFGAANAPRGEVLRRSINEQGTEGTKRPASPGAGPAAPAATATTAPQGAAASPAVAAAAGAGEVEGGGKSYAVLNANDIKSADPITRDDAGNVIPLSQRFNPQTPDIRYQVSRQPEIHRTVPRVQSVDEYKAILENMDKDPRAYYETQHLAAAQQTLAEAQEAELDRMMAPLEAAAQTESADNWAVMAAAERMKRLAARAESDPAARMAFRELTLKVARAAGTWAQLVRQMGTIRGQTPEAVVMMVETLLDEQGITFTETDAGAVRQAAAADIAAMEDVKKAEQQYLAQPSAVTGKILQEAESKAGNAKRKLTSTVNEVVPKTWGEMLKLLMQGNVLTPVSLIANVVGNTANKPLRGAAQAIASAEERLLHALGMRKLPRQVGSPSISNLWASAHGFWTGAKRIPGILKTGVSATELLPQGEVYKGFQPLRAWVRLAQNWRTLTPAVRAKLLVEGTAGMPAELMFRLLAAGDAPFYQSAYEGFLHELGRLRGLDGKALEAWMLAPDAESKALATERAKVSVYQGKSGPVSLAISRLANLKPEGMSPEGADLVNALAVRPFALFVKTPAQVAAEAHKFVNPAFSAAAMLMHRNATAREMDAQNKSIQNGDTEATAKHRQAAARHQREADLYLGRTIVGVTLWAAVGAMVKAGLLAGSGGKSEKEKELARLRLKPYHFNMSGLKRLLSGEDPAMRPDDVQVDYRNMGIVGLAMNIAATGDEIRRAGAEKRGEPYQPATVDMITGTLTSAPALGSAMLDMSMLKGTYSLLQAIRQRTWGDFLASYFETVSSVAMPNTLKAVSRAVLPYMPETEAKSKEQGDLDGIKATGEEIVNRIATKLYVFRWAAARATGKPTPFPIEDLPARVDLFGRLVPQTPPGRGPAYHLVDTFKAEQIQNDIYAAEVDRVYKATNDSEVIPPRLKTLTNPSTKRPIPLTTGEIARLQQIAGVYTMWSLDNILRDPRWNSLTPYQQAAYIKGMNDAVSRQAREEMLKEMRAKGRW